MKKEMQISEKVSPMHPDKIADRIAGALVDYCYAKSKNPKCAFEVLIGHGKCFITGETSVSVPKRFVKDTVRRISQDRVSVKYIEVPQDKYLAKNQRGEFRCGDNGVFAGFPMPWVHLQANRVAHTLYDCWPYDGKIVLNMHGQKNDLTICWSNTPTAQIQQIYKNAKINPIGEWTGGTYVDTGITGRKLASDFYGIKRPLGGGTMHGKDLSKADCSVNIYCFMRAQRTGKPVEAICSIGDTHVIVNGKKTAFSNIVEQARKYINQIGGFEKLAEWGLQ